MVKTPPSPKSLLSAVRSTRASLLSYDPDGANDPATLLSLIQDDHFMWQLTLPSVASALAQLQSQETPAYDMSSVRTFSPDWSSVRPLLTFPLTNDFFPAIYGIHHAQGGVGSLGCYVLFTPEGVVILKQATLDTPYEIFASALFRACGMSAPRMRPLPIASFRSLTQHLRSVAVSVKNTCGALHESRAQESGGFLMQFLPGEVLGQSSNAFAASPALCHSLGRCVALDLALNNHDRFPLLWTTSQGNASNLLIMQPDSLHAIDQALVRILDDKAAAGYISKVASCIAAFKSKSLASDPVRKLRVFLERTLDAKLLDAALEHMCQGVADQASALHADPDVYFNRALHETRAVYGDTIPDSFDPSFALRVAREAMG